MNSNAYKIASQTAANEIYKTEGNDQFFAWYNRGHLRWCTCSDYLGAAQAYDQAFQLYPALAEKDRPWRMLWYQTGPYFAYFYTGRYQDVINLASETIDAASEPYHRRELLLARDGAKRRWATRARRSRRPENQPGIPSRF